MASGPIILCDDGSDAAAHAVKTAAELLGPGREAVVLHIWLSPATMVVPDNPAGASWLPPDVEKKARSAADIFADEAAERAREAGFEARGRSVEGRGATWHTIIDVAREENGSLIVCGAQGHGPIKTALLGSVSEKVSRHADRPVLVVHQHKH